jgi:hypothetical protein
MPSIVQQLAERTENLARKEAKADFFKFCHLVMRHGGAYQAREFAGAERARERVKGVLQKAAISAGTLESWSAIADYQNISTAFLESLRSISVSDSALDGGMVKAPLRSRGFTVTTGISGSVIPEVSVKPIGQLVLGTQLLEPKKAVATIVVTKELMGQADAAQLFNNELTKAVVAATDSNFITALIAATAPSVSSGGTLANIVTDLDVLLAAVVTSATSKLYYVASPSNIKGLVAKSSTAGSPAFPELTITGGPFIGGITAIASDSISSSAALLFDATAIVGNSEGIIPGRSEQGTLQMESTAPDSPPTASTVLLSLWQNDLICLRLERFFGFTIMRSSGVASLSGVNY